MGEGRERLIMCEYECGFRSNFHLVYKLAVSWDKLCSAHHGGGTAVTRARKSEEGGNLPPGVLTERMSPFMDQIPNSPGECGTLAALRDTHLQKLLSREAQVRGSEQFIGQAV